MLPASYQHLGNSVEFPSTHQIVILFVLLVKRAELGAVPLPPSLAVAAPNVDVLIAATVKFLGISMSVLLSLIHI